MESSDSKIKMSWVWWHMPVIIIYERAEVGGSHNPHSQPVLRSETISDNGLTVIICTSYFVNLSVLPLLYHKIKLRKVKLLKNSSDFKRLFKILEILCVYVYIFLKNLLCILRV